MTNLIKSAELPLDPDGRKPALSEVEGGVHPFTINSQLRWRIGSSRPLAHGMHTAAVQALCPGELGRAIWAHALSGKCVEGLAALPALPEVSERRCGFAPWTRESFATRQLGKTR